ncbi:MAG: monovalent cation/H+ antiporter subunit D family protein [Gammaproteobacteria bacterium]
MLQVVLPLLAAPLCVLLKNARLSWWLALLVTWGAFGIALTLLSTILTEGPIVYAMGGWAAPWGIEYRMDVLSGFMLVLVSGAGAVTIVYARDSVEHEVEPHRVYLFYTAYLLFLTGLLGVVATGDAFNLFVFVEISSLSSYALISFASDRRALVAAYRYLIMGTIGATFILIAIGLLYALTGTLNMADLAQRLPRAEQPRTLFTALAFLLVGASLKLALFPLHAWLPNAYTYAPSVVSALMAATGTKVFIYVLVRFSLTVFGSEWTFETIRMQWVLVPLGLAGALIASGTAIFQSNVKRLLAYSSVAQVATIVLGFSLGSVAGLTAGLVHLFNHALIKAGLFLAVGCVALRTGSAMIGDMDGLARRMPLTMAAFVVCALSLIGIPFTAGFISKWYLVSAALEQNRWGVAGVVLLSSLLAVVYLWRVIEAAYLRKSPVAEHTLPGGAEAPWSMLLPLGLLVAANLYFGVDTRWSASIAQSAAQALLGQGP